MLLKLSTVCRTFGHVRMYSWRREVPSGAEPSIGLPCLLCPHDLASRQQLGSLCRTQIATSTPQSVPQPAFFLLRFRTTILFPPRFFLFLHDRHISSRASWSFCMRHVQGIPCCQVGKAPNFALAWQFVSSLQGRSRQGKNSIQEMDCRCWSMLFIVLTRDPFWVSMFDPQPDGRKTVAYCRSARAPLIGVQTKRLGRPSERASRLKCANRANLTHILAGAQQGMRA